MAYVKRNGRGVPEFHAEKRCSLKKLKDLQNFMTGKLPTNDMDGSSACVQKYVSADKSKKCGKMSISHSQRIPFVQLTK